MAMKISNLQGCKIMGTVVCWNRQKGLQKAKAMAVHIAYPDELLDDMKLEDFYEKVCNLMNWIFR